MLSHEIRSLIEQSLGELIEYPNQNPPDESRNFRVVGAHGIMSFISPVSEPYCGSCNRMRITVDGRLHLCLLHDHEVDPRPALRADAPIEELADLFIDAVQSKPTGHDLERGVSTRIRSMYQVGG